MGQNKILLAIDGSEHSHKVVDKTIEFAKLMQAEVILVYCHKKFPELIGEPYRDKEIANILSESEDLIRPFLQRLENEKIPIEKRIMEEPAGKTISNVAEIEGCDLIIMGSRGLGNIASLVVGSVTNKVLQTTHCSVLVVR